MKKSMNVLFFILLLPLCFACSKDEEPVVESLNFEEKIIGSWIMTGIKPGGIGVCQLSTNFQFSKEGTVFLEVYTSAWEGGCQSQSSSGSWVYLGNHKIEVDFAVSEENFIYEITFFDDNKAFKIKDPGDEAGVYNTFAKL